ncbi:MAG: response regulator transcription factor [Deltaproteobacteria bacterium]|nr:response regulator transcription factor [Deltaproteobacteria bacterium]
MIGSFEKNQTEKNNDIPLLLQPWKIILAEDHVRFRSFIKAFLEAEDGLSVVGEADDGVHLLEICDCCVPDLIILDINMPRLPGLDAARRIKELHPGVKVLILTMHNNKEYLQEAMALGAEGFLLKERVDTELIGAIRKILNGGTYITPLMAEG